MKKTIILIDEPLEGDHRVLKIISNYHNPIVIDCFKFEYNYSNFYDLIFRNIWMILYTSIYIPIFWVKFYQKYHLKPDKIIRGLKASLRANYYADKTTNMIKSTYNNSEIDAIYANDLNCALVGIKLSKFFECKFIYDAHEVEFHRNRKNSLFRVVFDMLLEQQVVDAATKVIVVNKPIKKLYIDIYKIPESKITIVDNNHFSPHMGYAISMFNENIHEIAVVYVGGGINNRKLESLACDSSQEEVKIYSFFLSKTPDIAYKHNWILGSTDYLPELLELIKKKRSVMWACTEDICLSYRLSLPNKFFQAMAVGIPVIAYKGTYLAEIVQEYNLGYVYNDHNFGEIMEHLKDSKKYYALLEFVSLFQEKLFVEKMVL
ncbi:MAG TPA: hypothetical protein EYG73_05535 [Arcobacter sp.]|nr:hypothetical protein [Arcobacter sp.]